jgi:O-acetyl-ADP-ribose deacetylase (regulator of RNase III)
MISTAKEYLSGETQVEEVIFCLYSKPVFEVFETML